MSIALRISKPGWRVTRNPTFQRRLFSESREDNRGGQGSRSSSSPRYRRRSNDKEKEGSKVMEQQRHIDIRGLPTSATPADIIRLARQSVKDDGLANNIASARLHYHRFLPTGRGYLSTTTGFSSPAVARAVNNSQMSSMRVQAQIASDIDIPTRRRGVEGLQEAAERGVLDGNGYGAGIEPKGCDVVLYGLPGTIAVPALKRYLRKIGLVKLAPDGEPDCVVIKIDPPKKSFTRTSKHVVRLNSPEDAHSFVRRMHMTFFLPEQWQQKYLIRARVIY